MFPLQPSNPTTEGFCKYNIDGTQDKDLKITFVDMIEGLEEKMDKSLKEIC